MEGGDAADLHVQAQVEEKLRRQIHNVSDSRLLVFHLFFSKQETACHSLLFHYKGEGFTCDLSAREPLLLSTLENLERIPALCGNVTLGAHFNPFNALTPPERVRTRTKQENPHMEYSYQNNRAFNKTETAVAL